MIKNKNKKKHNLAVWTKENSAFREY